MEPTRITSPHTRLHLDVLLTIKELTWSPLVYVRVWETLSLISQAECRTGKPVCDSLSWRTQAQSDP